MWTVGHPSVSLKRLILVDCECAPSARVVGLDRVISLALVPPAVVWCDTSTNVVLLSVNVYHVREDSTKPMRLHSL